MVNFTGMKRLLYPLFCVICLQAAAQELILENDSIAEQVESDLLAGDSLDPVLFALPIEFEFIPAEESPELVADRLSCLQKSIPLTYNSNVHGFINFFTRDSRPCAGISKTYVSNGKSIPRSLQSGFKELIKFHFQSRL